MTTYGPPGELTTPVREPDSIHDERFPVPAEFCNSVVAVYLTRPKAASSERDPLPLGVPLSAMLDEGVKNAYNSLTFGKDARKQNARNRWPSHPESLTSLEGQRPACVTRMACRDEPMWLRIPPCS